MITRFFIFLFKLNGWKIVGTVPPEIKKAVVIAAPHTSNWDGIWVRVAFAILGIPVKIAVKDSMTKFPVKTMTYLRHLIGKRVL